MSKKSPKIEYRYYEIPENELVLALLGESWIRSYGEGIDYLHFHNYLEVGICYSGKGEVVMGEEHYGFSENSFVIIPPNIPHTTNAVPGTFAYWEWMYFDIEQVIKLWGDIYLSNSLEMKTLGREICRYPFYFQQEEYPRMAGILKDIRLEMEKKEYLYRESIRGLLYTFLVEMLRLCNARKERQRRENQSNLIGAVIDYVEEHYQEEIKISRMAKVCSISESHFRRVFHEIMNMKPLEFVNLVRIQKACDMMKKSRYSMEEIAYQCGFGNSSTFTRNFKRVLGITPYQWKKSAECFDGRMPNYQISVRKGWQAND